MLRRKGSCRSVAAWLPHCQDSASTLLTPCASQAPGPCVPFPPLHPVFQGVAVFGGLP